MHTVAVVTSPCLGTKDTACVGVCPVDCFFDAGEILVVHPGECINCGLCYAECPVSAIFPSDEVPEDEVGYIDRNQKFFEEKTDEELESFRMTR